MVQVFILCAIALFIGTPADAGKITLTFATDCAPGSMRADAEDFFLKEIETLSNGGIKIQRFWGSSLLKSKETLKGIQDGVVDMAMVNSARYPERLKYVAGISLIPRGPISYENKIKVFRELYNLPIIKNEIAGFGQKPIYMYTLSYLGMAFNTPVKGFVDFKGRRVRASSRWLLNAIKALGGVPVSLPFSDVYMALQTKAIDGIFTNVDALHRGKIYEVAPYLVVYKGLWTPAAFTININQKKYDALSEEHKKVLEKASASADKKFSVAYDQWMTKMITEMENGGGKISFGTQEDLNLYLKSPAHDENDQIWVSELKKQGIDNGNELLDQVQAIVGRVISEEK